jgi:hypothetical protein
MSVKASSAVWQTSVTKGGELLVLLALADRANDAGMCYPGLEDIAGKSRLSIRQVRRCIRQLEKIGELIVELNDGPRWCNRYTLTAVTKGAYADIPRGRPTPDKMSHRTKCPPDKSVPEMSAEPSGTVTPPKDPAGYDEGVRCAEFPGLEEVLKFGEAYAGCPAKGVPAKIPALWSNNYFHYRTFEAESWPVAWKKAMVFKFELDWVNGHPNARGILQFNRGKNGGHFPEKNGLKRERGEILQQIEIARERGLPGIAELERELAAA